MSTRAIIIRKSADGCIEYAQTKYDGMDNTATLNKHYREQGIIDELFRRMSVQGLSSLYETLEKCDWYDEGDLYFYGKEAPFDFTISSVRRWLDAFDFPEFASVWDGREWHDFPSPMFDGVNALAAFLTRLFDTTMSDSRSQIEDALGKCHDEFDQVVFELSVNQKKNKKEALLSAISAATKLEQAAAVLREKINLYMQEECGDER